MSKRTKITAIIIVVAAAAIIAAGATLAFFTDSDSKTNSFTTGSVTVELREPKWDGYTFDDPENTYPHGKSAKSNDPDLGFNKAQKYGPGDIIPKNPQVKNTDNTEAWVAIKVKYSLGGNILGYSQFKEQLLANNGLDFKLGSNSNQWTKITNTGKPEADGELYMYNSSLKQNGQTGELFTEVPIGYGKIALIKDDNTNEDVLPSFAIDVQGFGVQAENLDKDQAKEQLKQLAFGDNN